MLIPLRSQRSSRRNPSYPLPCTMQGPVWRAHGGQARRFERQAGDELLYPCGINARAARPLAAVPAIASGPAGFRRRGIKTLRLHQRLWCNAGLDELVRHEQAQGPRFAARRQAGMGEMNKGERRLKQTVNKHPREIGGMAQGECFWKPSLTSP
jgi:hypothetical protein